MLRHRDEPWYDDARRALEQEDAGDYDERGRAAGDHAPVLADVLRDTSTSARRSYVDECIAPERANPDALKLFNEGIAEWDMRPELARIDAPTLVITGD